MEKGRSAFTILTVKKPTGPLRKPRRIRDGNIRIDLKEIGINIMNWIDSTQDRDYWRALVDVTLNLRFS